MEVENRNGKLLTKEEVKQLPFSERWVYLRNLVIYRICKRACPNEDKWNEWQCRGCLIRALGENGQYYEEMGWYHLVQQQTVIMNTGIDELVRKAIELHTHRFIPRYACSTDSWYVWDEKLNTVLPYKNEYRDTTLTKCNELSNLLGWLATAEAVKAQFDIQY